MLETIAAMALCAQVTDYAAFHLSYDPEAQAASDALYEQSDALAAELATMVSDTDTFIITMHDANKAAFAMDGAELMAEVARCQDASSSPAPAPGRKG